MSSNRFAGLRVTVLVLGLIGAASLHLPGVFDVPLLAKAVGAPPPAPDPANEPGACPEGQFCGKQDGFATGCSTETCCGGGQTYCSGFARTSSAFLKYKSASENGTCISFDGLEVTVCTYIVCTGGTNGFCDATCTGDGAITMTKKRLASFGDQCPLESE